MVQNKSRIILRQSFQWRPDLSERIGVKRKTKTIDLTVYSSVVEGPETLPCFAVGTINWLSGELYSSVKV